MKKLLTIFFLLTSLSGFTQTANNFPLAPFQQNYSYSSNTGYYGGANTLNTDSLVQLLYNMGGRNVRVNIPDYLITPYGAGALASDFAFYQSLGLTNMTAFLGGCYSGNSIGYTFAGCSTPSYLWAGMYDSIYLWNGAINTNNKLAYYVYQTVNFYKTWVKVWEMINEPMLCGTNANSNPANSNYWLSHPPIANNLVNLQSPIYYYIRALRIAWTVIKTQDPTAHVAIGGNITWEELQVMANYTDNPGTGDISGAGSGTAGSITSNFPLKGTAYFDVLDMHIYPQFSKSTYDNNVDYYGNYASEANSDGALSIFTQQIHGFDSVLIANGYNGTTYPKKYKIITEMDAQKTTTNGFYGNDTLNVNFAMKDAIKCQALGVLNGYKYATGDADPSTGLFNNMGAYGDLSTAGLIINNCPKDMGYYGNLTMYDLLYGATYDAAGTSSLSLPSNLDGVAFLKGGNSIYAIWAKTTTNQSEHATGSYTLPAGTYTRYESDYSQTGSSSIVSGTQSLGSSPSFFLLRRFYPCYY